MPPVRLRAREVPWVRVHGLLIPDIPPHVPLDIDRAELAAIVVAQRAVGATWTFDWDCGPTDWWFGVCDDPAYDVDRLPNSNARRKVRAGLARTRVERVEAAWLVRNGYDLYMRAFDRYAGATMRSPEEFRQTIEGVRVHPGDLPWEFWGAFDENGRLVAAAYCRLQPPCLALSSALFDPGAKAGYPMNALYFEIARHYLRDRGFSYVQSGSRPLLHRTNVDDFRTGLGWRRCYAKLGVLVLPPLGLAARAWRTARPLVARLPLPDSPWIAKADGLAALLEIGRAFETSTVRRNLLY